MTFDRLAVIAGRFEHVGIYPVRIHNVGFQGNGLFCELGGLLKTQLVDQDFGMECERQGIVVVQLPGECGGIVGFDQVDLADRRAVGPVGTASRGE